MGRPCPARSSIRKRSGSTRTVLYARHRALLSDFSTRRRSQDLEGMVSPILVQAEPWLLAVVGPWSLVVGRWLLALDCWLKSVNNNSVAEDPFSRSPHGQC